MYLCYIDEAGCTGRLPSPTDPIQPLLAVGATFVSAADLHDLTRSFLNLKQRYFPPRIPRAQPLLDRVLLEIKGADLRRDVRQGSRAVRRRAIGFLDDLFDLIDQFRVAIVARIWVKPIGPLLQGTAIYTSSIQSICSYFQSYLTSQNERGFVIADSRSKAKNINVAHSVFTQKFKAAGDEYNRILEMPAFGNSDNHVGLQLTDLLCSAVLFPIAAYSYCLHHVQNLHVHVDYSQLKQRYGPRLAARQYRYQNSAGRWTGGIVVSDQIGQRSSVLMFR